MTKKELEGFKNDYLFFRSAFQGGVDIDQEELDEIDVLFEFLERARAFYQQDGKENAQPRP